MAHRYRIFEVKKGPATRTLFDTGKVIDIASLTSYDVVSAIFREYGFKSYTESYYPDFTSKKEIPVQYRGEVWWVLKLE